MVSKFHFRFTIDSRESAIKVAQAWVSKFSPTKYMFSFEVSKEGVSHVHSFLEYINEPAKSSRSDFYKKHKINQPRPYHMPEKKDTNILYIIKDQDIILHNFPEQEYKDLMDQTEDINEDKKKDIKDKLIHEVSQKLTMFKKIKKEYMDGQEIETEYIDLKLSDVALIIEEVYVDKWDKLPPNNSLMYQYVRYVGRKLKLFVPNSSRYASFDL